MTYPTVDIEKLKGQILAALQHRRLSQWQRSFLSDMLAKLERYGPSARLSEKQAAKLREILGSPVALLPSKSAPSSRPVSARSKMRRHGWNGSPWVRREIRWFKRKVVRTAVSIAILVIFLLGTALWNGSSTLRDMTSRVSDAAREFPSDPTAIFQYNSFTVTDGDTIKMRGASRGTRLVGFNAPEIFSPDCVEELKLGRRAHERLEELVATAGKVEVNNVACACRPGTEGTYACNYGRACAVLKVDGTDVGQTLISEGLAAPYVCGPTSCPRTPKPWCE